MSRPLRLQFPGALYHVTSRGDRKAVVFADHTDRIVWLSILAEVCAQYNFVIHGFCQMTNHFHIVVETIDGNLARGMQQLNGVYSQYFNRRHNLVGHLFQGRYKGILAQRDAYLLELTRYVVLNPVRAGLVRMPDEWPWSSYRYFIGDQLPPAWLDVSSTLALFSLDTTDAIAAYRQFVIDGIGAESPLLKTVHQLILGDPEFVAQVQHPVQQDEFRAVSKAQRRALTLSLDEYKRLGPSRDEAMASAYYSTAYTMEQIGACFSVSSKTVSRAVKRHRAKYAAG